MRGKLIGVVVRIRRGENLIRVVQIRFFGFGDRRDVGVGIVGVAYQVVLGIGDRQATIGGIVDRRGDMQIIVDDLKHLRVVAVHGFRDHLPKHLAALQRSLRLRIEKLDDVARQTIERVIGVLGFEKA